MNEIEKLELYLHRRIKNEAPPDSRTVRECAQEAFRYFHEMAKRQVIDEGTLEAMLKNAGL